MSLEQTTSNDLSQATPSSSPGEQTHKDTKRRLAAQLGITAEFVRVPMLSKMLGISANSIYAQMSSGTFPMPHRKVGNVVLVLFDDFVDWYGAKAVGGPSPRSIRPARPLDPPPQPAATAIAGTVTVDAADVLRKENREERALRIKLESLAAIRSR